MQERKRKQVEGLSSLEMHHSSEMRALVRRFEGMCDELAHAKEESRRLQETKETKRMAVEKQRGVKK